jgi:hypothetical protein
MIASAVATLRWRTGQAAPEPTDDILQTHVTPLPLKKSPQDAMIFRVGGVAARRADASRHYVLDVVAW